MTAAELSEESDNILTNAVIRFRRMSAPGQDPVELKHEAWLLLPKVEAEYNKGLGGGDFVPFAIQRLAWRLFDVARKKSWAPRDISPKDRKMQMPLCMLASVSEIIEDRHVTTEHPADEFIEQDAFQGLADRLKSILPSNYQEEFELYYVQGMTMKETGDALGLTESRVSQKMSAARQLIHERFPNGEGAIAS